LFRETRAGVVLREEFGLGFDDLRELGLQDLGDARMEVLAAGLEQGAVGGVLDQRVLEAVDDIGRGAAAVDQLGRDQLVERGLQLRSATAASSAWENSRPSAAPIWATSLIGARRSSRASSESCRVDGSASGGSGPASS
jgi:hypothetical protein